MAIRIGINGFGRIGRNMLRASFDDPDDRTPERFRFTLTLGEVP